jgi:teichuronic acid biosynthesis glycosyltransferase TuaC
VGACDVMTLPSWAEGTPNVVLEALASGRPVVGTRVGGIPDVLRDERSGILVPPRDPGALAAALHDALVRRWDVAAVHACSPGSWPESAARVAAVLERAHAGKVAAGGAGGSAPSRAA